MLLAIRVNKTVFGYIADYRTHTAMAKSDVISMVDLKTMKTKNTGTLREAYSPPISRAVKLNARAFR